MFTQKEINFAEQITKWTQSIGINLDRDPMQV